MLRWSNIIILGYKIHNKDCHNSFVYIYFLPELNVNKQVFVWLSLLNIFEPSFSEMTFDISGHSWECSSSQQLLWINCWGIHGVIVLYLIRINKISLTKKTYWKYWQALFQIPSPNQVPFPFGIGKRRCVGETVARTENFLFLTNLMKSFSFRPGPDGKLPELRPQAGLTNGPSHFWPKWQYECRLDQINQK